MVRWQKLWATISDPRNSRDEIEALLPASRRDIVTPAIPAKEVMKVALKLKYQIEQVIPCELEESRIIQAHSSIITHAVLDTAKQAGGEEFKGCVIFCLLICKRWFHRQALLELWDADLYDIRATACEVMAKKLIEAEEDGTYLMEEVLLKKYSIIRDGEETTPTNVIERAVDLHALRVIGSSGYQRCISYLWKGWLVQDEHKPAHFVEYKEKVNPSYFAHFDPDRMRAPIYQNALQVFFSLLYLALYTGAINTINPDGDVDLVEGILYIMTLGFVADELAKLYKVGRYYIGFWNVFNSTLYTLLAVSFITRMIALAHPIEHEKRFEFNRLSYNFLAFSAPMFWMRLLLYLDTFRFFGAMLVVLKVMMKESLIFFALLIVVMVGFLQAFVGMDQNDDNQTVTSFIFQAMTNSILQSPDFSGFDNFAPPFGIILYYIFTFVVMVVLLNILIALYNSAYEDITDNAIDEYMALFAQKTLQFVRAPDENVFIAPFNLIEIFGLILPFEWWMAEDTYARLNNYVMAVIYSPLLCVTAYLETRTAARVASNRRRGEEDDDTIEEWEQVPPDVDVEGEGWAEKVEKARPNVELDAAVVEVRRLRDEIQEMKKELEKSKGEVNGGS